jgi:predicted nucleic acid-binding Zn ribbon protein
MSNRQRTCPMPGCGRPVRPKRKYCSESCRCAARLAPPRYCPAPGCGKLLGKDQHVACSYRCSGVVTAIALGRGVTDAQKAQIRVLWDAVPTLSVRAIAAAVKPPLRKAQVSGITHDMDLPPRASPIRGHVTGPRKVPAPAIRAQRSPVGPTPRVAVPAVMPEREPRKFRPLLWTFDCPQCAAKLLNCAMP